MEKGKVRLGIGTRVERALSNWRDKVRYAQYVRGKVLDAQIDSIAFQIENLGIGKAHGIAKILSLNAQKALEMLSGSYCLGQYASRQHLLERDLESQRLFEERVERGDKRITGKIYGIGKGTRDLTPAFIEKTRRILGANIARRRAYLGIASK